MGARCVTPTVTRRASIPSGAAASTAAANASTDAWSVTSHATATMRPGSGACAASASSWAMERAPVMTVAPAALAARAVAAPTPAEAPTITTQRPSSAPPGISLV